MKLTLSNKIVGTVFIISILFFSIFTVYTINQQREILKDSYVVKSKALAYSLDAGIESRDDLEDKQALLSNIYQHIWLDPEIMEIRVNVFQNEEFITIVSSQSDLIGTQPDEKNLYAYENNELVTFFLDDVYDVTSGSESNFLRTIVPIHSSGQVIATYQFCLNLDEMNKKLDLAIRDQIISHGIMTILFVFFVYLFLKLIVLIPISKLSKGVEATAKGDFDYKVEYKSGDEIGKLTQSFNKMGEELKESHMALKKHERELEKTVEKRTKELNKKLFQLEKFSKLTVGREKRMVELKEQIKELEEQLKDKQKK